MDIVLEIREFRAELSRYLTGSPRSRWRQGSLLRELAPHQLIDIGLDPFTMKPFTSSLTLRPATEADMDEVQRIYGEHVVEGLASFEETPPGVAEMRSRFQALTRQSLPYIVAEQEGRLCGYSYAGPYRTRSAYRFTIENSVYVERRCAGQGIGRALLSELIVQCEKGPWRQMIAIIGNGGNSASIALHESLGFRLVGTLREVGFKHGQWVDTVLMQRALDGTSHGHMPQKGVVC